MLNTHQICDEKFGDELLSYMYGELDDGRRADFESHLEFCDACVAELASVADARLGVIEWRREDFEPLATPVIVLPAIEQESVRVVSVQKRGIASVIESIKNLPAWAGAGLALAPAAVLLGVFYFGYFSTSATGNDVAVTVAAPIDPTNASEPIAATDGESRRNVASAETNSFRNDAFSNNSRQTVVRRNVTPAHFLPRHVISQPAVVRTETASAVKTTKKSAPRLSSFDEDDDKSLRLADLFAQIGTSEEE